MATKAEVEGQLEELKAELGRHGIRVASNGKLCWPNLNGDDMMDCGVECPNCHE